MSPEIRRKFNILMNFLERTDPGKFHAFYHALHVVKNYPHILSAIEFSTPDDWHEAAKIIAPHNFPLVVCVEFSCKAREIVDRIVRESQEVKS
jgi:hypothetical protein